MSDGLCPFAEQIKGVTTFQSGYTDRVGFCDHAAGGFLNTMRDPGFWAGVGTSVHFAIGRDGAIIQLVNIFDTAWAQGRLGPTQSWTPYATMGKANPNGYLISTEHEDWIMAMGHAQGVIGSQWTPAQYAADLRVKRWCVEEVRRVTGKDLMRFGLDSLAGHHMFDSVNRAECPGRFWRDTYRQQLYSQLMGEKPVPTEDYGPMKLNADGSDRIESEGGYIVIYHQNVPVWRIGGDTAGQTAKLMGDGKYYNLAHQVSTDGHNAPVVFSDTLKD